MKTKKNSSNPLNSKAVSKYARTLRGKFNSLKNKAKHKGIVMRLTYEQFVHVYSQPCHYQCGNPPAPTGYNIDRIRPSKGYTLGNVIPCCYECNGIRSNRLTVEETEVVIRALTLYRNKNKELKYLLTKYRKLNNS